MKKIMVSLAIGMSLFWITSSASASTIWAKGVTISSGWYDAEKALNDDDDDLLCWAATASNILSWSRWNSGYSSEDAIFKFIQDEDEEDSVGWMDWAWRFWFYGAKTGGQFDDSKFTGYYSEPQFTANYSQEMDGGADTIADISSLLQEGWGVGIAVRGSNMDHAVTVWGIEQNDTGAYTGIYLSDSDNNKDGSHPRPDTLDHYGLILSGSTYYLKDFYGSDSIYIKEWQALKLASVPEPSSLLFLIAGLLGLGSLRRQFSKKS